MAGLNTDSEQARMTALRSAIIDHLESMGCTVALTLSYHDHPISPAKVQRDLRDLFNRFDRSRLGPRYHKSPKRTEWWAIMEKMDVSPHIHIGVRVGPWPDAWRLRKMLRDGLWLRYARRGTYNLQAYQTGWARYSAKALDSTDLLLLSP
jgi:hypothetical protein